MLFLIVIAFLGFVAMVMLTLVMATGAGPLSRSDVAALEGPPGDWFFDVASLLACYHLLSTRSRHWAGPAIVLALAVGGVAYRLLGPHSSFGLAASSTSLPSWSVLAVHAARVGVPLVTAGSILILDRVAPARQLQRAPSSP